MALVCTAWVAVRPTLSAGSCVANGAAPCSARQASRMRHNPMGAASLLHSNYFTIAYPINKWRPDPLTMGDESGETP